ncbi:hypothetical protein AVEN_27652-1 [Araneus ventricosus]|uniref:Uncharacterized protein n=1 Tax=Araneus ventricosus TaxID=182803 RepID=A0A4Y2NMK8_ARAVE|nr:hypothetical protein AVEN_27652-1 [Araneus ventricosus]
MFQAHINVEYCNSVKSIKYICKYPNRSIDMAVVEIDNATTGVDDEIARYEMGQYINRMEQFGESYVFLLMTSTQLSLILAYTSKMANVFISVLIMLTKELLN